MKKKIQEAMKNLGISKKGSYTFKELESIAAEAETTISNVMYYLRYFN